jgi:hypothetical protein
MEKNEEKDSYDSVSTGGAEIKLELEMRVIGD